MEDGQRNLTDRVSRLEEGLTSVNERLRRLEALVGAETRPAAEVGAPAKAVPPLQPAAPPAAPPSALAAPVPVVESTQTAPPPLFRFPQLSGELELLIGTSWLNRIGVIAIIAAAAFFLKYAFDNNWIGPGGRVGLTLLAGVVLVFGGERYQRRGLPTFGQGLTGGGIAILYLGVFAAFEIYRLIGFAPAFALMVLITASATLLALRYDSKVIALLSLVGGFATPLILGDGGDGAGGPAKPVTAALYAYFLALDAGGYALVRYKRWAWLGGVVLAGALLTPVIVTFGARPNPSAALVYFLVVTAAALALSATTALVSLAWVALAGGFILGPLAGAWEVTTTSPLVALGYFVVVTLGAMALAVRYQWRGVALAALLAGTLAGIAFGNRAASGWAIFPYLALVGGSALYTAIRHEWRRIEWIAAVATGGAATLAAAGARFVPALPGATAVFLTFSLTTALASRRRPEVRLGTAILAAATYGGTLLLILGTRDLQALAALALSAYHVVVGRVLLRRTYPQLTILVLAGLALTFLTVAVPLKLQAEAIPLAWSIEAVVLAWAAGRLRNTWAGRAAAIVGALAGARLLLYETPLIAQAGLVATLPGVAFGVGVAALGLSAYFTRSVEWSRDEERYIPAGFVAAAAALLLWWGGWEINGLGERGAIGAGSKQVLLSAWFTLYGFALVVAGIVKEVPSLRWAGIGLLGVTIGKVFFVDLSQVEIVFRILSLLVLGVLLVVASLVYGRYRTRLGTPAAKGGRI